VLFVSYIVKRYNTFYWWLTFYTPSCIRSSGFRIMLYHWVNLLIINFCCVCVCVCVRTIELMIISAGYWSSGMLCWLAGSWTNPCGDRSNYTLHHKHFSRLAYSSSVLWKPQMSSHLETVWFHSVLRHSGTIFADILYLCFLYNLVINKNYFHGHQQPFGFFNGEELNV